MNNSLICDIFTSNERVKGRKKRCLLKEIQTNILQGWILGENIDFFKTLIFQVNTALVILEKDKGEENTLHCLIGKLPVKEECSRLGIKD